MVFGLELTNVIACAMPRSYTHRLECQGPVHFFLEYFEKR